MNTLITGASGFVGAHLITLLLQNVDTHIVGFENSTVIHPADKNRIAIYHCDIGRDFELDIIHLVVESEIDQVYHLAAISSGNAGDIALTNSINIDGSRRFFQLLNNRKNIPRIAFFSTGYAYGASTKPAAETDNLPPENLYGIYRHSKLIGEQMAREYGAVIFRPFNMIGPGQSDSFAISSFARQIAEIEAELKAPVLKVGNLEAYRDFIDIRDAVRVFPSLLQNGSRGQAYNICSGVPIKVGDVLSMLLSLTDKKIDIVADPDRMRPSDIPANWGDPANTYLLTGWKPEISLPQTLNDCLDWWRRRIR